MINVYVLSKHSYHRTDAIGYYKNLSHAKKELKRQFNKLGLYDWWRATSLKVIRDDGTVVLDIKKVKVI